MLAVRALSLARRRLPSLFVRANTTLSTGGAAPSTSTPPPPIGTNPNPTTSATRPAVTPSNPSTTPSTSSAQASTTEETDSSKTEGRGDRRRRRRIVKKRAQISLTNPRKWNPPVKPGSLPVYDEALKLIKEDSLHLKKELKSVLARVQEVEKELQVLSGATEGGEVEKKVELERELGRLRKKIGTLEIQSEVNLPWVRWYAANGMADLTKPVYRHLVEQRWRNYGALDLLMERIHQMNVVPDLLPSLHPSIDLRISFPEPPPHSTYLRTRTRRKYKPVEPGVYLLPEQTRRPPRMYTSVFHPETRYYTLVMVDADVPDPENKSFTTYLHWMQPNIALSAATCGQIPTIAHTKYIPPHPQRGSPYHRYCLFLLPHVNASEKVHVPPPVSDEARVGFNLRAFCEEYGLDASLGGGAHIWREVWDETVSDIYQHTLKLPEPHFGLPPRADPYADVKVLNKYRTK
ncbi:MRPL35 [Sanghuangporus sanghuang]